MLNKRQSSESYSSQRQLSDEKLKKRREQNRISQRGFRLRRERHTVEMEAKVEELKSLLETASRENSMAASRMNKMEGELRYYRCLLLGAVHQQSSSTTSYPNGEHRPGARHLSAAADIASYGSVPANSNTPSISSMVSPALSSACPRAESYSSSCSGSSSTVRESPMKYSRPLSHRRPSLPDRNMDGSIWGYLLFNTADTTLDDTPYQERSPSS